MRRNIINQNTIPFHLMLLVPVVLLLIFSYWPMLGIVIAFKNYQVGLGFLNSKWVGIDNFKAVLQMPDIFQVVFNTLYIAIFKMIGNLVIPVTFALLLNELSHKLFKRTVQTLTYLPHFLSWVILSGILIDFLSPNGFVNSIIKSMGFNEIFFLGDDKWFRPTMVITDVWKNFGFNTIVYLAALTGIDPCLYEASEIDGAGRWKQTIFITLPGIAQFVALMTILSVGNILNAGFEQIFNLYSPMVYDSGDIIDTLVYRTGLVNSQYSLSTAVGLFKSVVSTIMIVLSYRLADKFANYRVF